MRGTTKRKMFAHPKTSAGKRSEPEGANMGTESSVAKAVARLGTSRRKAR